LIKPNTILRVVNEARKRNLEAKQLLHPVTSSEVLNAIFG
jgi:hypothetical protein